MHTRTRTHTNTNIYTASVHFNTNGKIDEQRVGECEEKSESEDRSEEDEGGKRADPRGEENEDTERKTKEKIYDPGKKIKKNGSQERSQ